MQGVTGMGCRLEWLGGDCGYEFGVWDMGYGLKSINLDWIAGFGGGDWQTIATPKQNGSGAGGDVSACPLGEGLD